MNFSRDEAERHDFQIAPMIDIVFLLLIFFIVTYAMAQVENEIGIALPAAQSSEEQSSRNNQVVVNIRSDGQVVVNRRVITQEELLDKMKYLSEFGGAPSVIIRADENCRYRYVVAVYDICAQAGVPQIIVRTHGEENANASPR
ncbi:MAG: biopolymer transporter ExbD [Planctomycetes bacterium]|nr:biopolymer transporter ExbD [Planctomycetota bacterium]